MAVLLETNTPESEPMQDIATALDAMRKTFPDYQKAERYYEGDVPEAFASARMRRAMKRSGINYQLDFAATVVDSVVDRLELASITSDDESGPDDVIQTIMESNKLELQAGNIMRKACTYGDAYVIVWPRQNATSVGGRYNPEDIALFYQDPRTVRVFYSEDNPNEIEFAAKKWVENGDVRLDLYYDDRIESYVSKKDTQGKKAADFIPTTGSNRDDSDSDEDDGNPAHITRHDFGQVPVFHFKTDADQYGTPEHRRFYAISDILHKLAVGHMAGVDYQAFPQRYALLEADSDSSEAARLDEGEFSFPMQQGGTTEAYGTEARSQFKADPGSVWMANGIKSFGQFDVADAKNFTEPAEFYLRCGASITNTPLHYFDPSGDQPSGESLKTAEAPFVKKVKNRQASFGDTWRQIFTFALKLAGYPDAKVEIRWEPSASNDDQSTWEVAQQKQAAGVPVEQTLLEAGYSAVQVEEWEKDGTSALPQKVAQLAQIGEAVASFAPGVMANLITPEQVQAIVVKLLGDVIDDDVTGDTPDVQPEPTVGPPIPDRGA